MNTVDKLLKMDAGKIKKNEKTVTLYLSRLGEEFEFNCKEIDSEYISELQEDSLDLDVEGNVKIRTYNQKVLSIIESCSEVFKNDEIIKHFNCVTPKDLVKKIMTSGEMDELYKEINKLNGYDNEKEKVEDIKN